MVRARRTTTILHGVIALLLLGAEARASQHEPLHPLRVAVHVHSLASTGSMSVEDLAHRAEQLGLDAILLSENFTLRYEYGLPPLRQLLRVAVSYPSLLDYGIERYLREVRDTQARHPNLLLIPGIEAAPFSYWTGSLLTGDLTLHDTQKTFWSSACRNPRNTAGCRRRVILGPTSSME